MRPHGHSITFCLAVLLPVILETSYDEIKFSKDSLTFSLTCILLSCTYCMQRWTIGPSISIHDKDRWRIGLGEEHFQGEAHN